MQRITWTLALFQVAKSHPWWIISHLLSGQPYGDDPIKYVWYNNNDGSNDYLLLFENVRHHVHMCFPIRGQAEMDSQNLSYGLVNQQEKKDEGKVTLTNVRTP